MGCCERLRFGYFRSSSPGNASPCDKRARCAVEFRARSAAARHRSFLGGGLPRFAFDRESSKRMKIPEGFGFLVPQRDQPASEDVDPKLLACTFVDQKFAHRVPEGCVLLRAFFGGQAAPRLLGQTDEAIVDLALHHLSCVFGELPKPQIGLVRRWPRSLPQYAVGHRAKVAKIEAVAGEVPGLHLIGNAYCGVGLPDLIRQGRSLAERLLHF